MNTQSLTFTAPLLLLKIGSALLFALLLSLTSCKKESNDNVAPVPTAVFDGTYEKQSTDPTKRYTFVIAKVSGKANTFNISNFANFIPNVEATAHGNTLIIAKQTFPVSDGGQITLTGEGLLSGDLLNINYSVRGSSNFDGLTEAKRK